jgi:hypothetical protein
MSSKSQGSAALGIAKQRQRDNMHNVKLLVTSVVMILHLVISACSGPFSGRRADAPVIEQSENLVYLDVGLMHNVLCQVLEAKRLPTGRLRVYAKFYNEHNGTVETQIQVKFKGEGGRIIDQTGWMPLLLPRREATEFEHTSLAAGVSDFTLLLRLAR